MTATKQLLLGIGLVTFGLVGARVTMADGPAGPTAGVPTTKSVSPAVPLDFTHSALVARFDADRDGQLDVRERRQLRAAFGGIDVPALPWPLHDYQTVYLPSHFQHAGVEDLDNTPTDNPITNEGATLGRVLFYDRQLSRNNNVACASCHVQRAGFSDPRHFSIGFAGAHTRRNSMGVVNLRFTNLKGEQPGFFWDERAATLEDQVLMPIQDPVEMGMKLDQLETKLAALPYYPPLFQAAFGSPQVKSDGIARALAQFLRSILSTRSRFDAEAQRAKDLADDYPGFTAQENLGKRLFLDGVGGVTEFACAMCHEPPTFNMAGAMNIGLEMNYTDPGLGGLDRPPTDPFAPSNDGKFKAPSLRNIALTAPYMHDGRFKTLEEVVNHYSEGIHPHPNLSLAFVQPPAGRTTSGFGLTEEDKAALVAFLMTLTDEPLRSDARFSDPFVRADEGDGEASAAEQYQALVQKFQQLGGAAQLADQFLSLAQKYPDDPVAIDALGWVVINLRDDARAEQSAQTVVDRYCNNEHTAALCGQLVPNPSLTGESLLRNLLARSTQRTVQVQAGFHLARHLQQQLTIRQSLTGQPLARRRVEQFYGKSFARHLASLDPQRVTEQIEQLYDRVVQQFADVDADLTQQARFQLVELRYLAIGRTARDIEGEDIDGVPFRLSDYRGQVVVLTFWGHW